MVDHSLIGVWMDMEYLMTHLTKSIVEAESVKNAVRRVTLYHTSRTKRINLRRIGT